VFAWTWAGIGWLSLLSDIVFIRYLTKLRNSFAATLPKTVDKCERMEDQPLLDGSYKLPSWCYIDMDAYLAGRSWFAKKLSPHQPNRQNACFWLERNGPEFHLYLFQINLVFVGLYCAFLAVVIFPAVRSEFSSSLMMAYMALAILPMLLKMKDMQWILTIMSQVGCMGTLRNASIEATVIREKTTSRVIRGFLVLEKMHRYAENGFQARTGNDDSIKVLDGIELEQIKKTSDSFDTDATGYLSQDELENVMRGVGFSLSQEQVQQLVVALDLDGDGMVEKDEFHWYKSHMGDDDTTIKERAQNLFKFFTKEGNDDRITIGEFKTRLDSFPVGFTVDDVGEIVRAIDENGDVMISLKEFEKLLQNHYPAHLEV
jgi:Ca2+-binding EF-hand superfamily protein